MKWRIAAVAVGQMLAICSAYSAERDQEAEAAVLATPLGVTLMHAHLGVAKEHGRAAPDYLIFGNADSQSLYVSDGDAKRGTSSCYGECESVWIPFRPSANAKSYGVWSIVERRDGTKQWALDGKPLYTYAKDNSADEAAKLLRADHNHSGGFVALGDDVDGHHASRLDPAHGMTLPPGVTVSEILASPGQVLTDSKGMPLYVFEGKADQTVDSAWIPFAAPGVAVSVGDFTILHRHDGIVQWAYLGKPLYSYKGDLEVGDVNGKSVDDHFKVAAILNYFVPPEVAIIKDERRGGVFVSSHDGTAIYARDKVTYGTGGNHNSRGSLDSRGNPIVGQGLGLSGCDADCEKLWIPLTAQSNAEASGYWTVIKRADGTKQWAYQGFAVYTYTKDKPGDVQALNTYSSHDEFDYVVNNDTQHLAPEIFGNGLYWRVVFP